jgi:hypothetical protein
MLAAVPHRRSGPAAPAWRRFRALAWLALAGALASLGRSSWPPLRMRPPAGRPVTLAGAWMAVLVQRWAR